MKTSRGKGIRVVPMNQTGGAVPKKNFRGSPFIRNTPEYEIILKLGRIKGYDENRRILGSDGEYIPGSDVTMLMNEAMNPKRVLVGIEEFVKLLDKAKVDPDSILNDNIRSKLEVYKRTRRERDDNLSVPGAEIVRTTPSANRDIRNRQPSIRLERINPEDYRRYRKENRALDDAA